MRIHHINKRGPVMPSLFSGGLLLLVLIPALCASATLRYHTAVLDAQNNILPWHAPADRAYDAYLDSLWSFLLKTYPAGNTAPMCWLSCGYWAGNPSNADPWSNDIGEKIPNWFENARLYYAYTGDMAPMNYVKSLVDYYFAHKGLTPSNFSWPNFPYTTCNSGDVDFDGGFTDQGRFQRYELQTDLAGDMGMTFYKMYQFYGTEVYLTAAINVANVLADKLRTGLTAAKAPWPYVVKANDGTITSDYGSNLFGIVTLYDYLIENNHGNVATYQTVRSAVKAWLLAYPMENGLWVDGHSDTKISGTGNLSNTCKSNAALYLLEHPDFDPDFSTRIPELLAWSEDNFGRLDYGAMTVGEQTLWDIVMGYQTARQAAEYGLWYAVTGDESYRNKAYYGFNWATYMAKTNGAAADGLADDVGYWFSDCYGEGPRMYYYGFKAVPEWAPHGEDHILYSHSVLKAIVYESGRVGYTATDTTGTEYVKTTFAPGGVTLNGNALALRTDLNAEGYTLRQLTNGDYSVAIRRTHVGSVEITANPVYAASSDAKRPCVLASAGVKVTASTLYIAAQRTGSWQVRILDASGKKYSEQNRSGTGVISISRTGMAAGVYIIEVTAGTLVDRVCALLR